MPFGPWWLTLISLSAFVFLLVTFAPRRRATLNHAQRGTSAEAIGDRSGSDRRDQKPGSPL